MTISIYPGQMPSEPVSTHEWVGTIGAFFDACDADFRKDEVPRVSVTVNGTPFHMEQWDSAHVGASDVVEIRPIPFGFAIPVWALWAALAATVVYALLTRPKTPSMNRNQSSGRQLDAAEGKANVARLNQVVPELLGRMIRYPDYLTQPRRHFTGPRQQLLEMLLCVGPGQYQIDASTIKVGNTVLQGLQGASVAIHPPGADLSSVTAAQNWYVSSEVGGTSAGTAGLDLNAPTENQVTPSAPEYTLSGATITAASWPNGWGIGTAMAIYAQQAVTVARVTPPASDPYNTFTADWSEIAPTNGLLLEARGAITGTVRVFSLSGSTFGLELQSDTETGVTYTPINSLAPGTHWISLSRIGRVYTVTSLTETVATFSVPGWAGFAPRVLTAARIEFNVQAATIFGELAGPFAVCPASETTSIFEVDFFFPQGLVYTEDDGDELARSVAFVIEYRAVGAPAWTAVEKTYTAATRDQIGYTERVTLGAAIRPEVRIRRRGAKSTSRQVADTLQWYGARSLLPGRTSYPNWTTLSISMLGMGQISANSENTINLVATRILPVLQADGTFGNPQPTRDISAAVNHVITSLGETSETIEPIALRQLHDLWSSRGEGFNAVIDGGTAQDAVSAQFAAGMAEMTITSGQITPVREGPRTMPPDFPFSAQNTTGRIERSFRAHSPDDNDGVEIEFQDEAENWEVKTIECLLPGSLGIKLQKIKLQGVTSKRTAYRIGMREASRQRYSVWTFNLGTELDALCCEYGSLVSLTEDIPGYGQSALLLSAAPGLLRVSEPLRWVDGADHVVALRKKDGTLAGPFQVMRGATDYEMVVGMGITVPEITLKHELPHVLFGTVSNWSQAALVTKISSSDGKTCKVVAKNYDERIYQYDDSEPA